MRPLRYLSVCSGIEAASVAWEPLGWEPVAFSQFDPEHDYSRGPDFPSHMLATHYPDVVNHGDMTRFDEWPDYAVDVLVGGTPCQSFSVAGLREGLGDSRGNLMLVYAAIARRYRPDWLAWENVPGVLSSDDGRDFASLLGLLSGRRITVPAGGWRTAGAVEGIQGAYGIAWRVLDAQFVRVDGLGRAVPQRRRRVFLVGYSGDWRRSAAVLFERESLQGHSAPRRKAREDVAGTLAGGARKHGGYSTDDIPVVAGSITASAGRRSGIGSDFSGNLIAFGGGNTSGPIDVAACLTAKGQRIDFEVETFCVTGAATHALTAEGHDATEDGTGRGTPIIARSVAIRGREHGGVAELGDDVAHCLRASSGGGDKPHVLAFQTSQSGVRVGEVHATLDANNGPRRHNGAIVGSAVRRLTPLECERLQGFPDGYTNIPWRRRNGSPDSLRYKALGNSMAVNAMRWLGRRIDLVRSIEGAP